MNFIRKVSSTETDINFAICNTSFILRKSLLSFLSTDIQINPIKLPALAESKQFSFLTGNSEFVELKNPDSVGYFHISSFSLPQGSDLNSSKRAPRLTLLSRNQVKNSCFKKESIVGFTSNFSPKTFSDKSSKLVGTPDFCDVSFSDNIIFDFKSENMAAFDAMEIEAKRQFLSDISGFGEQLLDQSNRQSFVIVMHYGDLIYKTLGDHERISLKKGSIFGLQISNQDEEIVDLSSQSLGLDYITVKGPCKLISL